MPLPTPSPISQTAAELTELREQVERAATESFRCFDEVEQKVNRTDEVHARIETLLDAVNGEISRFAADNNTPES